MSNTWKGKPGVRAVVVDDAGRILILLRPDNEELFGGYYNLPGGGKEEGETFLEGTLRELAEETGLTATPTGAGMTFHFPGGYGKAYLLRHPEGELRVDARESVEAKWVYPDELPAKLMPPTMEIVRALAGREGPADGEGLMEELVLTPERHALEVWASKLFAPWLEAHVKRLAGEVIAKGQLALDLTPPKKRARTTAIVNPNAGGSGGRSWTMTNATGTDAEGEELSYRVLERAWKMGASETARAILSDAKAGKIPAGRAEAYKQKTLARLRSIARQNVRLIRQTTERKLANLGAEAEAANVATLLIKLYDMARANVIGRNTVAGGYVRGVADVLRQHGYRYVYNRTMADDRVCKHCRPLEGRRYTLIQYLSTFPYHPMCRCYPHTSPTQVPAAHHWRAKNTAKIVKSMSEVPMKHQTALLTLRTLAGDLPSRDVLVKSMLLGEAPPTLEDIANREIDVDAVLKSLQAARPKPSQAVAKVDAPSKATSGEAPAVPGAPVADPNSPTELRESAEQLLLKLRAAPAGSSEHKRLADQYHMVREALRAFHGSKGVNKGPALKGPDVKLPKVPAFVHGGAEALASPRQFEIAVAQVQTREDAMELGHYFDALMRRGNHAGEDWERAWAEIKEALKHLPSDTGDAPVVAKHQAATAPVGSDEHGTLEAKKDPTGKGKAPLPGDRTYGDHFASRVKASYDADMAEAAKRKEEAKAGPKPAAPKAAEPKPVKKKPKAKKKPVSQLSPEARAMVSEHKRLIHVLGTPSHADDKAEAARQNGEMQRKFGIDLLAREKVAKRGA